MIVTQDKLGKNKSKLKTKHKTAMHALGALKYDFGFENLISSTLLLEVCISRILTYLTCRCFCAGNQ